MYYYFSSNYPAVIKLNGIYYGTIHNAVKSLRIDDDAPFVEVCPLNSKESPTALLLDEAFFISPPKEVVLTDMDGGYMLKFNGGFSSQEFKVIAQQKFSDAVITAFSENGYKLSIETEGDFYAENIEMQVSSCEIARAKKYKNLIAVYFYGEKTLFNVYKLGNRTTKIFSKEVLSAEINDGIITVESLSDIAKHKITTEWEISGEKLTAKSKKVEASVDFNREKLSLKVVSYAFLEEFLVGGDYKWYLGGSVLENCDRLKEYLGEFIGVMPPPVFREIDEVGLIYLSGKNSYKVRYFTFEIKEGKIVNITC